MLSFFPRGVLDEILNLIESVSEGFPSYSFITNGKPNQIKKNEEIHVMLDGICFPRPTFLVPSATTVWKTFLGSELSCSHCKNDKLDKGIMDAHLKVFASTRPQ